MDNSIAVAAFPPLLLDRWRSSVERLYILSIRVMLILPVAEIRYYHRCLADDMGVSDLFSGTMKQNRLYSRLSLFSFSFSLFQLCHNGEAVGTSVHAVKRRSIQQKNSLLAVVHGTKVASSVKHVRKAFLVYSASLDGFCFWAGNTLLTLASYKDFSQDVFCKSKWNGVDSSHCWRSIFSGCYQDKLHPHERNRKQLESKFNKQPGGGASSAAAAAAAAPAAEPAPEAAEEE